MFRLDSQLAADTTVLGNFPLSRLLLSKDANYPWCILVPRCEDVTEIYHLTEKDQQQLLVESSHLAQILMGIFKGDKMNIAALGNVVAQLHLHHIVRYRDDIAWPGPVWGKGPVRPYPSGQLLERAAIIVAQLGEGFEKGQ